MAQLKETKTIQFLNRNIHWILTICIQSLLILLCFSRLTAGDIEIIYYNADYLYLPSLYIDIFMDGNLPKSWNLTPNPYFFPDMILYFIIYPFSQNAGITLILFDFFQLLLLDILIYKFIGLLIEDKRSRKQYFLFSVFFIQLFLLAGAIFKEPFISHLILICSAHMGAVLCSLLSFYLFGKFWKTKQAKYLWILGIVMFMSIVSDRLYLIHTVIPLFVFAFLYLILKKKIWPLLIIVLVACAGWFGFKYFGKYVIYIPDVSTPPLTTQQSIHNFIDTLKFAGRYFPFTSVLLSLHLFVLVFSPAALFWFKKEKRIIYFVFILSAILSFVFPIYYGFFQKIDTFRYIIHSYVFLLLIFPIAIGAIIKFRSGKIFLIGFYVLYIGIILLYSFKETRFSRIEYFIHYKFDHIQLVQEHSTVLKNGIADYWHAKNVYVLGGKKNRVVSVSPDFMPFIWQANIVWYTGKKDQPPPIFNFSINLRPDSILGTPIDSIKSKENTIFIYPDFIFKKDTDGKLKVFPYIK